MRSFIASACILATVFALPIAQITPSCPAEQPVSILEYSRDTPEYIKFNFSYSTVDASADESLAFQLKVPQCSNSKTSECLDVVVNGQTLHFQPDTPSSALHTASIATSIEAVDSLGDQHTLSLRAKLATASEFDIGLSTNRRLAHQQVQFHIQSVDNRTVRGGFFSAYWTRDHSGQAQLDYLDIMGVEKADVVDFKCLYRAEQVQPLIDFGDNEDDIAEEEYIIGEIEALRLLEQQAVNLEREIALRREAVSRRIVDQRTRKPLQELIDQCDGVLCAAGQIATRLYDNINLATSSHNGYGKLQQPMQMSQNGTQEGDNAGQSQTTGDRQSVQLESSNNFFLKALAFVASALGLTAIFAFVKRKCMSMRRRVERAADREERRNARAYRKAARRAEMRRRWDDLVKALTFFKKRPAPRMTDYDEKRALILQDALLEQDFSQLEKGDIMEAEIRELRHAHEIVSGIIRSGDDKSALLPPHDPPPSLVPLPSSLTVRSRSSTATLPSYNSEEPPDYSSIPDPTNENTTTDGFAYYQPSSIDYNTQYIPQPPASSSSSRPTRSTPISSVAALSPRVSFETLRTRASRTDSRVSRPQ